MLTGLLIVGAAAVLALWLLLRRPDSKAPRSFTVLIWALASAELMPGSAKLATSAAALFGGLIWWLRQPSMERRGPRVVGWSVAILAYWTLLLVLLPSVPSLATGLLGWRQTVFALGGLILGCAVPRRHLVSAEQTVIAALTAALAVSLVSFFWVPSISQMVTRAAGEYTGLFDGQARLQGIFAGPFHVALAAVLLVAWFFVRRGQKGCRALATVALFIGLVSLKCTEVRTGFVALAVVLVTLLFLLRRPASLLGYLAFIALIGGLGFYEFARGAGNGVLTSIANYSTDSRLLNRLSFYKQAVNMIDKSILFGWGPGSAGDTLGYAYGVGEHVTPHNFLLKIAVEGGLIGVFLWLGLAAAWCGSIKPGRRQGQFALLAIVAFLTFGITTPAIDTLPVSYFVMVFAGLAVGERIRGPASREVTVGDTAAPTTRKARRSPAPIT